MSPADNLVDCGNWEVSASWPIPSTATSGYYIAKLKRDDAPSDEFSHIVFIVRDDASHADVVFQSTDTSWQAYNNYSPSFYNGGVHYLQGGGGINSQSRAFKVSYNRPFYSRGVERETWLFGAEYPLIRWLEQNSYDVTYISGMIRSYLDCRKQI